MTRAEFLGLPSKAQYGPRDRVVTWDRASRPVLEGVVEYDYGGGVCLRRGKRRASWGGYESPLAYVRRSRVRLAAVERSRT